MVANCSNSLDTDVLRCILSIYIKVTCTLKASHSVTSICVTMSLPVCIVDVRSVKSLSSGRFWFTGSYLEEHLCPAPSRTALLVLPGLHCATASARAHPGCHGDRSVFVNDRVHVEVRSRWRVGESAQGA